MSMLSGVQNLKTLARCFRRHTMSLLEHHQLLGQRRVVIRTKFRTLGVEKGSQSKCSNACLGEKGNECGGKVQSWSNHRELGHGEFGRVVIENP